MCTEYEVVHYNPDMQPTRIPKLILPLDKQCSDTYVQVVTYSMLLNPVFSIHLRQVVCFNIVFNISMGRQWPTLCIHIISICLIHEYVIPNFRQPLNLCSKLLKIQLHQCSSFIAAFLGLSKSVMHMQANTDIRPCV